MDVEAVATSLSDCRQQCQDNAQCEKFTYSVSNVECYLKAGETRRMEMSADWMAVSGKLECGDATL